MRLYLKFGVQVLITAISAVVAFSVDNKVDAAEWILVIVQALGAIGVLGAGNLPAGVWRYTKTGVSAATAGLMLLVAFVSDGGVITSSEWLQVLLAVAAAAGVLAVKGPVVLPANTPGGAGVVR